MRRTIAAMLLSSGLAASAAAETRDLSSLTTTQLIDELTGLHDQTVGIAGGGMFEAFLADDEPPRFTVGLLPVHEPAIAPPMREIVRRGAAALPALIAHLRDPRRTAIAVGSDDWFDFFGGQYFSEEYFARDRDNSSYGCDGPHLTHCRLFKGTYTVAVGDVCEVLIGQIVDRPLTAVRYQPTAILYVNSPVQTPALAARIARDWSGLTKAAHRASLLHDLKQWDDIQLYRNALVRLRFYFPKTYAGLTGAYRAKRDALEAYRREYPND